MTDDILLQREPKNKRNRIKVQRQEKDNDYFASWNYKVESKNS